MRRSAPLGTTLRLVNSFTRHISPGVADARMQSIPMRYAPIGCLARERTVGSIPFEADSCRNQK
jgi:hypothetical protein